MLNGGNEFIAFTDGKNFYMESLLKSIVYGYCQLVDAKTTYSRKGIESHIRSILNSDVAHVELEDYLSTDLINKFVRPNMGMFGLERFTVDVGVRETKQNVTIGHLDIKFALPSLKGDDYYAFESKRIDNNKAKQDYYIGHGIERFTGRKYYPECDRTVAGMIGFVEKESKKNREKVDVIAKSINTKLASWSNIDTTQALSHYLVSHPKFLPDTDFLNCYSSKHTRPDDNQVITIYHIFLDYYNILN